MNGVNSVATFIQAINNPETQKKYTREFNAFDLLLRNSGFTNGYKDLNETNIEDMFVKRGTIGNLGFYDRQKDMISYIYVKLNPKGESKSGIAAWKLTTEKGCYLYILHTCGNAFYPNTSAHAGASGRGGGIGMAGIPGSCKIASVETNVKPLQIKNDSFDRKVHITINLIEGQLVPGKRRKDPYDTVYQILRKFDTLTSFKDKEGKQLKIFANPQTNKVVVCRDTTLKFYTQLMVDSSQPNSHDPIRLVYADTIYRELQKEKPPCKNKLEIDLDGGMSFSSVVRYNSPNEHSQTDGAHFAGEFAISQIFSPWFQAGLSASYITLSYQDDFPYPGATPGTYSRVILGNPIIPVQLFGKFTIGKQLGWQSTVALSVGYSFPMNAKIVNNGTTLTTDPAIKSAPTAGLKLGLNYFFTCKFGLGIAVAGQYFSNQGALMKYSLFSLPVTGGLRIRF
ncbi:MAG: hypothetical protein C5B59_18395 [Bacteroidetes bacterium]|nr:MAG: hypothetical protein C5B59_18395 [Bacteroidota bacterium]